MSNHFLSSCSLLFLVLLLCLPAPSRGQAPATEGEGRRVRLDRLVLVGGGAAAFRYLGFKYVDRAWYQGKKLDHIRWLHDWSGETYLHLDKGGHFLGGFFLAQTLTDAYAWSGFGARPAALLGTLTSWAALLEIEMRDAYFDQWGFSIPDFAANTLGASVPLVHALFPSLRVVRFKFSYHPSRLYLERRERAAPPERPHTDHLIDDYEGMTFWMTIGVNPLLRGRAEAWWPDFLGLALGYGATGLHGSNVKSRGRFRRYQDLPDARPEIFLALDADARFLPGQHPLWQYLKEQFNWLHLPSPAVRLYPEWRLYLFYM
jgi:hypothetical protein